MKNTRLDLSGAHVLIVDDQPSNIQILYRIFQGEYEVHAATSGAQALEFCRTTPPDLILLDVMMPDMDGLAVCWVLKTDPDTRDIPIIFVTAQSSPDDETMALETGGVDFITKPVNPLVVRARVRTHLMLKTQSDYLRSLVFLDGLTGVANRRRFDEALAIEWRQSLRRGQPLGLLMIDIDFFKRYNDHYGHQAGDVCLQTVAQTLLTQMHRPHDLVARYGGEEFVCLMPECHESDALVKAEALRKAVQDRQLPHIGSSVQPWVTLSVGVAVIQASADSSPEALIRQADEGLYSAKAKGRNQVHLG